MINTFILTQYGMHGLMHTGYYAHYGPLMPYGRHGFGLVIWVVFVVLGVALTYYLIKKGNEA